MGGGKSKIVSAQANSLNLRFLFTPPPRPPLSLSLSPSLSLSFSSYTDRSTDASAGIRSLDSPSHHFSAPLLYLLFTHLKLPPWWTDNYPSILRPWVPASAKVTKVSAIRFVPVFLSVRWSGPPAGRDKENIDKVSGKVTLSFVRDNWDWGIGQIWKCSPTWAAAWRECIK